MLITVEKAKQEEFTLRKKQIFSLITNDIFLIACLLVSIFAVVNNVDASENEELEIAAIQMPVSEVLVVDAPTEVDETITSDPVLEKVYDLSFENTFAEKVKTLLNSDEAVSAYITTYGTDCVGCYNVNGVGGTASGIGVSFNAVKQADGTWQDGITYEGYYIVAANGSIPFGSIIKVSNHGYSGNGLTPGVPFYAIVLDRGAMTINHLDLFVGSQVSNNITIDRSYSPVMELVRYGY